MFRNKLILFLLLGFSTLNLEATHIMGGNIVFEHIQGDEYDVGIKVFVDCYRGSQNALYEEGLIMGLYSKSDNKLVQQLPLDIQPGFKDTISIVKEDCANPVDFCMFLVYYSNTFNFDKETFDDPLGYYISWERCCRNSVILNIRDADEVGIAFYAEVPPFNTVNSIPTFTKLPLNLLCVNSFFEYNFKIIDPDGDSLSISLTTPLKGRTTDDFTNDFNSASYPVLEPAPYNQVVWNDGFGLNNIMDGNPQLSIDSKTGVTTVTPGRQGDFVFAIKVEEFRDGKKIGEVIREMQYKVSKCATNTSPEQEIDIANKVFEAYPGSPLSINFTLTDADGDSVFITAQSSLFESEKTQEPLAQFQAVNGKKKGIGTFTWTPTCDHISNEPYEVVFTIRDNGCPFPSTSTFKIFVNVAEPPIYAKPIDFCVKRISEDSLLLNWNFEEDGSYFGGVLIERKIGDEGWERVDTVDKKRIREYRAGALANSTNEICFRISVINICREEGAKSDTFCSILHVDKAPLEPTLLNVSVNNDEHIDLIWTRSADFDFNSYQINRAINGDVFDVLTYVYDKDGTTFTDSLINADSNFYSYYIVSIDDCSDNSQRSEIGTSILLSGKTSPYDNMLFWNAYTLWNPKEYNLEGTSSPAQFLFAETMNTDAFEFVHDINGNADGIWSYKIHAVKDDLEYVSFSNTLDLIQEPIVYIPNAFSPNKDNLNENWEVTADYTSEYFVQVFNRWGQLVFQSEDPTVKWDGDNAMEGTYLYKLSYRNLKGRINFKTGSVHIIK